MQTDVLGSKEVVAILQALGDFDADGFLTCTRARGEEGVR